MNDRLGAADAREAAALGSDRVRPSGEIEDGAPSNEALSAEQRAAAEQMHDPQYQFDVLHPERLPVKLYLPTKIDEEREIPVDPGNPDAGTQKAKISVDGYVEKPIWVRYDLKPRDIAEHRIWDHFDEFQALIQVQLRAASVDVPEELTNAWFDAHPGYVEAAVKNPNVRAKARDIVAILAECEEIRDVDDGKGGKEKRMLTMPVPLREIELGLDRYMLDIVILTLNRKYNDDTERRQAALGKAMKVADAGKSSAGAAPAISTRS